MATIERYQAAAVSILAAHVRRVVKNSGVVAIPTESFYGLGVSPFDERGLEKLWRIKTRSAGKPILLVIGVLEQLYVLVKEIPPAAAVLMDAWWPGPLTIVFPAAPTVPDAMTAGTRSIGIRLTAYQPLAELLRHVGPLTGTSANREGEPPPSTADLVQSLLGDMIDLIVDGGPTPGGLPSTVIDARGPIRVLREGAVDRRAIARVLISKGFQLEPGDRDEHTR